MSGIAELVAATLVATTVSGVPHVAVVYTIEPGWHIYWENPGESGMPTTAELRGPVGAVKYPGPDKFIGAGDIVNYGWEKQAALFFPLTNATSAATVHAETRWLACREDACVPGSASLSLVLPSAPIVVDPSRLPSPLAAVETPTSLICQLPNVTEVFLDVALAAVTTKTTISDGTISLQFRSPRTPGAKFVARSGDKYYQVPEVP